MTAKARKGATATVAEHQGSSTPRPTRVFRVKNVRTIEDIPEEIRELVFEAVLSETEFSMLGLKRGEVPNERGSVAVGSAPPLFENWHQRARGLVAAYDGCQVSA